jgi:proton glutamate symport protein
MEKTIKLKQILEKCLSPWAVLAGMGTGICIGFQFQEFAKMLIPFGELYLSLLQMCILPILITAVVSSLGRMIRAGHVGKYMGKLLLIFGGGLVLAALVGMGGAALFKPGSSLDEKSRITLGKLVSSYEMGKSNAVQTASPSLMEFVKNMVPTNVFAAFSHGQNLAILFFCILLGIALGFVHSPSGDTALSVAEALYDAFQKLISWVMYALPLGLCCLFASFASQMCHMGAGVLSALTQFVLLCYGCVFLLILIYHCLIWWKTGGNFFRPFYALRETLVVAFGTSSSLASIPSALRCLEKNLKINRSTGNLVVPLGVNINPQGSVLHFALSTFFIAQIYNVHLGVEGFFIALIGSIFAGMAATGMPGGGALSMLALVLEPLGLPSQAAIVLLLAIDPILDPVLTVLSIHANCTATVMTASGQEEKEPSAAS